MKTWCKSPVYVVALSDVSSLRYALVICSLYSFSALIPCNMPCLLVRPDSAIWPVIYIYIQCPPRSRLCNLSSLSSLSTVQPGHPGVLRSCPVTPLLAPQLGVRHAQDAQPPPCFVPRATAGGRVGGPYPTSAPCTCTVHLTGAGCTAGDVQCALVRVQLSDGARLSGWN